MPDDTEKPDPEPDSPKAKASDINMSYSSVGCGAMESSARKHDREEGHNTHLVEAALCRHIRNGNGSRLALLADGVAISYERLAQHVAFVQRGVLATVKPGDRVVILLHDSVSFAAAFFATIAAGAIAAPISTILAPADRTQLIRRLEPALLITYPGAEIDHRDVEGVLQAPIQLLNDESLGVDTRPWNTNDLKTNLDGFAYCLFSSGTTGAPKCILLAHQSPMACLRAFEDGVAPIGGDDRIISIPKMTFGYGLVGNLLFALLSGSTSILQSAPFDLSRLIQAIERDRPTMLLAQPRVITKILDAQIDRQILSSIRVCISAGESLPKTLFAAWASNYRIPLLDALGSTELGHIFVANKPSHERGGSTGRVVPGYQIRILAPDGSEVADNEKGELVARGIGMTRCYLGDTKRTAALTRTGWVHTGDFVSRDADGYLTIHGRTDDLIKVGCGEWIIPAEIEEMLSADIDVLDCAVVGQANAEGLLSAVAFIVRRDFSADPNLVARTVANRLSNLVTERWPHEDYRRVEKVVCVDHLPRSANGKLNRLQLRAMCNQESESTSELRL
ncbi:AMP-binding protein [Mesorhizobium sp. M1380]|uniref:AMP-binding protein n=1 Tax=Mesorhizobium sp. M1380 TaxID=2957093 RepID=UPI0033352E6F